MSLPSARGWGPGWPTNRAADTMWIRTSRSGTRFQVHKRIAVLTLHALEEAEARGWLFDYGPKDIDDEWSFNNRPIGGTKTPSDHSWGLALDVEATDYPWGSKKRLPQWLVDIFIAHGFEYGGDWSGKKDPMHFGFAGTPADADRITRNLRNPAVIPVQQRPTPPPPDLIGIHELLQQEDEEMIVIRDKRGIAFCGNGKVVGLGLAGLEGMRKAYRDAGRSLPEYTCQSDAEWVWFTKM